MNSNQQTQSKFALEVKEGLNSENKSLSSKYFYDTVGDALFQQIMQLEEYYPTRSEYEILNVNKGKIAQFIEKHKTFSLLELGAGDGTKTKLLLQEFTERGFDFDYVPIDISKNAIDKLSTRLSNEFPTLRVNPIVNTYEEAIVSLDNRPKLILFLGSNIGNFSKLAAANFLKSLHQAMSAEDLILLGIDLKKNPKVVLDAYNDAKGVTKAFNLNLLARINRELGADFDLLKFDHYPTYNPETGEAKSYLVSLHQQEVYIKSLKQLIKFKSGEIIHTEVSNKYSVEEIGTLAERSNFKTIETFYDCKHYFVDVLWQK